MANRRHQPSKKNRASRQKAGQQDDGAAADGTTALTPSKQRLPRDAKWRGCEGARERGGGRDMLHAAPGQLASPRPVDEKPSTPFPEAEQKTHEEQQSGDGEEPSTPICRWSCSASFQRDRSPSVSRSVC
ncbi:hypothetical protein PspLS_07775 [Pyricularia sp. CBS 133598]|nr:hypothetical protein PspLS_07775 [Pyricularia sp. CBS 133598]